MKTSRYRLSILAAAGVLAVGGFGATRLLHSQDASATPAPTSQVDTKRPTAPDDGPPPPPKHGPKDGPGPRGERPPPPPRPEDDLPPAKPVDPQAAPAAVKMANDTLAKLSPGQVWTRTAPRGEQLLQVTLLCDGKEVARLEFDPATGALQARGQRPPAPPAAPQSSDSKATTSATNPAAKTANLDSVKGSLDGIIKELSVGQGAEAMPREGFWKVPLISQSRVVGEMHFSGDGTKLIQDFAAARDAAIATR